VIFKEEYEGSRLMVTIDEELVLRGDKRSIIKIGMQTDEYSGEW